MSATFAQINTTFPADDAQPQSAPGDLGSGESSQSKSPLAGFNFFKGLNPDRKLKADGQPPKRRGPKPDSKPALTRRQELNRQAQRTHRERKEMYIKALEQEVLHLKEYIGNNARELNAYKEENLRLREVLVAHGIKVPDMPKIPTSKNGIPHPSSSGSFSGSYQPPSSASTHSPPPHAGQLQQQSMSGQADASAAFRPPGSDNGLDYDQIGVDFVLAWYYPCTGLEKPCMDHMQMLCVRSQESEAEISGHALMATCPPQKHLVERPDVQYPHQMPDMHAPDLLKLLDLSNRLPLAGEITPVMAWANILQHENCGLFIGHDFADMKEELLSKVRCYGFGAVLEEFEVVDAIQGAVDRRKDRLTGA